MSIRDPLIERLANMGHPLIDVDLTAGQTEATLTAKCNAFLLQAMLTHIGDVAGGWLPTPQHLLDDRLYLRLLVTGIALLEGLPVIAEDLLKGRSIDPLSVVCHGRGLYHTLPSRSTIFASLAGTHTGSLERGEEGHQKRKVTAQAYQEVNSLVQNR
jgi:hypothetical protein